MRLGRVAVRASGPPAAPRVIGDGIEVTDDAVWAWALVPPAATYLAEEGELTRATWELSTALGTLLPPGADYHLKIVWTQPSGSDYRSGWEEHGGVLAPGTGEYVELGARRIDRNAEAGFFRRRVVLLGLRLDEPYAAASAAERTGEVIWQALRSEPAARRDARVRLYRMRPVADRWFTQLAGSALGAGPAPAGLIAWAYAREVRRVPLPVPGVAGGLAGPALVDLMHGEMDPTVDPEYVAVTDLATGQRRYVSLLVAAVNGFPVDELMVPGGEWLELLSDLPGVEASVRGVNHGQTGSIALLDRGRKVARSQSREAAAHGGQAPWEVLDAEEALGARRAEVQRRVDVMTTSHPRWVVDADSPAELAERVAAVQQRYSGLIRLEVVPCVQDLLWQELLPGDRVRVGEFAQHQPMRTLAGSWFHGGSSVGDDTGPYVGANLGSTPGPVRMHLVSRAEANLARPTSVSFTGMSGAGKSTAVMLTLLGALAEGAWALLVDPKGDLAGVTHPASELLGVPVQRVDVLAEEASGTVDPMRFCPTVDQARALTVDALLGALHAEDRRRGETLIERAVDTVLRFPREAWSAPRVISELMSSPLTDPGGPAARELGQALAVRARQPGLRAVLGPLAATARPLLTGRGLVYVSLAGLDLPRHTPDPDRWTVPERCAMTTFRTTLSYALLMSRAVREMKKVVAVTELHLISGYPEGRAVLEWLARTGRALQTWLLLDTQSATDLAQLSGLVEQLVMSFAFRASGRAEQDAQAVLLGRPEPGPRLRQAQAGLSTGQCVLRDRHGRLGVIEFDRLTDWIATALSTNAGDDTGTADAFTVASSFASPVGAVQEEEAS